jgi:RND superfamily putative drug exporter
MKDAATNQPRGLARLAEIAYERRRLMVIAWVALLIGVMGLSSSLKGDYSADYATPGSESKAAADLIETRFGSRSADNVDVVYAARDVTAPAVTQRVDRLLAQLQQLEGLGDGVTTRTAEVAPDRGVAVARVPLTVQRVDDVPDETGERLLSLAERTNGSGVRVELGGLAVAQAQESETSSEGIGMLIAAGVLAFTFGTLVATGMPLITAVAGLAVSGSIVGMLAALMDVPDWAPSVAAMIGIGVGIDYALLIVTRFRAAIEAEADTRTALVEAVATAGRSVLVAGTTVVVSLMGLFLMGLSYLQGVALAATLAVLVAMAASVTLLPALLAMAGPRINRLRIPGTARERRDPETGFAARWSRMVQRRPVAATLAGVALLLALAAPVADLRLGFPDAGNDREETTTRQAYELTTEGFGPGSAGPITVVAKLERDGDQARLGELARRLDRDPGVASVSRPELNRSGDTALLRVAATTSPQASETPDVIERVRDEVVPATGLDAKVGGTTAAIVDQSATTAERLPLFIGAVVGLAFLLLVAAFRAPLVALKAGVLNVLSIAAAYGVVALVADGGFAGQLVGVDTETPVPPFIPVMMFAILFGLSMDYEVFLLSRIREAFLRGGTTSDAVTEGVANTARVITAAALIMVAVFGAFVLSDEVFLKLIGVGLASAILIDATVVRMVLVPAVMQLLGERSWWMPRWVDRFVPEAQLEAEPAAARG